LLESTEGQGPTPRRLEYYGMLKANVRALIVAASNLLNMGRLESGRFAVTPRRTDLDELLRGCAHRLTILSRQKEQTVELRLPDPPRPVRADPEALTLVVTNLLSNAIKYTPEKGRIELGVAPVEGDPGRVRVYCRDTGIGISAADRDRVFSGYYRTESGQQVAAGFGVGLSLARKIVEAHGYELDLDSEPGKGSTFSFTLPLWTDGAGPGA